MRRLRPHPFLIVSLTLTLASCVSAAKRNLNLVRDRTEKLRPLSSWPPTWCRVEARLNQPTLARYRTLFPDDHAEIEILSYSWKTTEETCAVAALRSSPVADNFRGVLDAALCRLVQTHFVNSPFDELDVDPRRLETRDGRTLIRTGEAADVGLYLDPKRVHIQTRTQGGGTLNAEYESDDGRWVPRRMSQRAGATVIEVSDSTYGTDPRTLVGFTVGVGTDQALPMAQVTLSECQRF